MIFGCDRDIESVDITLRRRFAQQPEDLSLVIGPLSVVTRILRL